jgi:hypothetical protein
MYSIAGANRPNGEAEVFVAEIFVGVVDMAALLK